MTKRTLWSPVTRSHSGAKPKKSLFHESLRVAIDAVAVSDDEFVEIPR